MRSIFISLTLYPPGATFSLSTLQKSVITMGTRGGSKGVRWIRDGTMEPQHMDDMVPQFAHCVEQSDMLDTCYRAFREMNN